MPWSRTCTRTDPRVTINSIKNMWPTKAALSPAQVLFCPDVQALTPAYPINDAEETSPPVSSNSAPTSLALIETSPLVGVTPSADMGDHQKKTTTKH